MSWSPDVFRKALFFAAPFHKGQTYGGAEEGTQVEYVNHLTSVVMEVISALPSVPHYNGNLAIQCALLHDVIEDTEASYEIVLQGFGPEVADGVLALTKNPELGSKRKQMADSLERILQQPHEVWMVKLADRITNLHKPPHYWKRDKIIRYRKEGILIRDTLGAASEVLEKRLTEKIEEYQRLYEGKT